MKSKGMPKPKIKLFGLVRDKNGKPKVGDIHNCPPEILALMTKQEIEELKNVSNT